VTSAWAGMVGLGATPVCGMAVRGVSIDFDDPGASSAGSGDWAFARDIGNAMLPASAKDTIRMRIMGFPCWPQHTNVDVDQLVPPRRPRQKARESAPTSEPRDFCGIMAQLFKGACSSMRKALTVLATAAGIGLAATTDFPHRHSHPRHRSPRLFFTGTLQIY
jgi:hypothetical protein